MLKSLAYNHILSLFMPELPEVETIKRELKSKIKGKKIADIKVLWSGIVKLPLKNFIQAVKGQKITDIERRAKILIITLSSTFTLLVHLKMTGQLIYAPKLPSGGLIAFLTNPIYKYARIAFVFSDKSALIFNDLRKFAYIKLVSREKAKRIINKEKFGPEPLGADFTLEKFTNILKEHPKRRIKQLLMDQTAIAGVGNIYSDEICFYAGVLPIKPAGKLPEEEITKIYKGIKEILPRAIKLRGSSVDSYVDANGKKGNYVKELKVYDREGEKCFRCGGIVKRIKLGGRSSYFCSACQK